MPSSWSFPRHLAIVYVALLICASLYPMSGWRETGLPIFDYLVAPWPKYFELGEIVVNLIGYMPLGLVMVPALPRHWAWKRKVAVTVLFGMLFSFCMETMQNFLPTRVSSNVDLFANTFGAFLGALAGVRWGQAIFAPGRGLARWRERYIADDGLAGDIALILIVLWVFVQLTPDQLLFAGGELRRLLDIAPPLPFGPGRLIMFEAAQTASMMLAIGLFARCTLRVSGSALVVALLVLGMGARLAGSASFFVPSSPLAWLTPGVQYGFFIGVVLLFVALRLPRVAQHALAGASLLMASVLINMMPESPYFLRNINGGPVIIRRANYPNFYALCRLIAAIWPFVALAYLSGLGLWRGERLANEHSAV
ncbi:MAG: VanZ family protein [Betaproteobacteria bacterium]|nr:VanZ family protein [Betaproteobacteria bacterium]